MKDKLEIKTIKVSAKGQIAIPSDIRKGMKIMEGEELLLVKKGDRLLIEKASKASKKFESDFNFMLLHAEKVAKKLWENAEDDIWDKV